MSSRRMTTSSHCAQIASALGVGDAGRSAPSVLRGASSMTDKGQLEVRAGLAANLTRLWRYGLMLSGRRDTAEDLVQATCVRALERGGQFEAGSRLDRWLFSILRSIWLNEVRARKVREGGGLVDAEEALTSDGGKAIETNILAAEVFRAI